MLLTGPSGTWLGQDGHDLVGPTFNPRPNDIQDIHIALTGLPTDHSVTVADVRPLGGGEWIYRAGDPGATWGAALLQARGSSTADLYVEPFQIESGRPASVALTFDDGSTASFWVQGGTADPNLRMAHATMRLSWTGQAGRDETGPGPAVGPDGLQDAQIALSNLSTTVAVTAATVTASGGGHWAFGTNPQGLPDAELFTHPGDPSSGDLYFSPQGDLAGQTLTVAITYADGKTDTATVTAGTTDPTLADPPLAAPPAVRAGATVRWAGQDGTVPTIAGGVHLVVGGLPAGRTIVGATLSDGLTGIWAYQPNGASAYYASPYARPLSVTRSATDPTTADFVFPPYRSAPGEAMTLRIRYDDGTESWATFAAGTTDVGLIAPRPPATSVVAHPGDDLNALANAFGTVNLSPGVYNLNAPLVLNSAVSIVGQPGAILMFTQPAGSAPWTAAIKIEAGHTTLSGFAVRFTGPVSWNEQTQYGPAVIGTTDNFDQGAFPEKVDLVLTGLDLESPPVPSGYEQAPRLMRLVTAQNGQITNNILKGGDTEVMRGPWQITGNDYRGTVPNTYAFEAFAGHATYGVTIANNTVRPLGPSGKTWRFLTLTQGGQGDTVRDNRVSGIGPMDDDTVPSANAPELILTESYGLRFEGRPSSISTDGRVVQIADPQGGPAQTGDVLSILDGPNAGRYVRVAQAIDANTYLLDSPLPAGSYNVAIAPGFVGETFSGNTIDATGSKTSGPMVFVGNHYGTQILDNHLIGGAGSFKITAAPTETPVIWGWSHAPFLGATIQGNVFEDSLNGGLLAVEHGASVKSTAGRTYFSATFSDNTFRWSAPFLAAHPNPVALTIGDPGALDAGELALTMQGNHVDVPTGFTPQPSVVVNGARINGQIVQGTALSLAPLPPPAPTGLALVADTGASATDGLTNDGRVRFDPVAGAVAYEYRVGTSGNFLPLVANNTAFVPSGLVQGLDTVAVRAVDALGQRGAPATLSFTLDTVPPTGDPPSLRPESDSGASATDRVTNVPAPVFQAPAAAGDVVALLRNGAEVARRLGPGAIGDPGVPTDGTYVYTLRRVDPAGNRSDSRPLPVVIDTTPPAPVTGLTATGSGQVGFSAPADAVAYQYRVESGPYVDLGGATSFAPAGLVVGANTVAVRAIDLAGNIGPRAAIVVDMPPPITPSGTWLGQDGSDRVGPSYNPGPDGIQDIHLQLANLPADAALTSLDVRPLGGGEWIDLVGNPAASWGAAVVQASGATTADLYLAPFQVETGRPISIAATFADGRSASFWVQGGAADPALAMPTPTPPPPAAPPTGVWMGQDGTDLVGTTFNPRPDGIQDVHVRLTGLPTAAVTAVDVRPLGGGEWIVNQATPAASWGAAIVQSAGATQADLYLAPYQVETGRPMSVALTFADGSTSTFWIQGGPASPTLRESPNLAATWLGQTGADYVGRNAAPVRDGYQDIGIALSGLPADRTITSVDVRALGGGVWQYHGLRSHWAAAVVRAPGTTTATLYIEPARLETGRPFTITVGFSDGSTSTVTLQGGSAQPHLIVPRTSAVPRGIARDAFPTSSGARHRRRAILARTAAHGHPARHQRVVARRILAATSNDASGVSEA